MMIESTTTKRRLRAAASVGAAVAVGALASSGSALAAAPTGDYADFRYCPYQQTDVVSCVKADSNGGSFKLGNTTVPVSPKTITLQGGLKQNPETFETTFVNANGAPTLSPTPLNVPGGLTGLIDSSQFNLPLLSIFKSFVARTNDVTATAELVGPVGYNAGALLTQNGPAVTLPLRIKLSNPFLGDNCYIGSSSSPVTLRLTTGTTAPPRPNTPISGSRGTITVSNEGNLLRSVGYKLVDNAFSVPAASGCGYTFIDRALITGAVNLKTGLPSAAGRNSATLTGTLKQANADAVRASVR